MRVNYTSEPTPIAQLLINEQQFIDSKLDEYGAIISKARTGAMGLTLDEDKTPEWREAKRLYSIWWAKYQTVNKSLSKLRKPSDYIIINGKRVIIYKYKAI